ncbi:MAG: DNA replication/repair protein RecF [Cyclobacteriaceae bacterium]|nr:DNA replication/repair protein RecF [Cyclobacteriaceae bacterium]
MHLKTLQLKNFKNYSELNLEFPARITFLLGLNGTGKTNLLDAIYYLSATKSFSNLTDSQIIRHGEDNFFIRGMFDHSGNRSEVFGQLQSGRKKIFRVDSKDYERISDHIGKYPVVLISPLDVDLVKESSEARRKFFDQVIAQLDHAYLEKLLEYHHTLKQRNALLKLFAEKNYTDLEMIELYDQQLIRTGQLIYKKRKTFATEFLPVFNTSYHQLVNRPEMASLTYTSEVESINYEDGLKRSWKKDLALQRTTFGVHRDDYMFGFAHGDLKRLGSQGQQKSFLVAIKLAQANIIRSHLGFSPILLFDDIFDKLDDTRITRLLKIISADSYGQVLITDAGPERTLALVKELGILCDVLRVDNGSIHTKAFD